MNPILIKPGSDQGAHLIVEGRAAGTLTALDYGRDRTELIRIAVAALDQLRSEHEVVLVEGAGAIAEPNLRAGDLANLGLARRRGIPVLVAGDIDRGGVFSSLYGSLALLSGADQDLIAGFVINRFRGAPELLRTAVERLTDLTGRPVLGVVPWLPGLVTDQEDSLSLDRSTDAVRRSGVGPTGACGAGRLRVAAIRLPRVSNSTDLDPFTAEATEFAGGCRRGAVYGTNRHGCLADDDFRRTFLAEVAGTVGADFEPDLGTRFEQARQRQLDRMADLLVEHLDLAAVRKLIDFGAPTGLPRLAPGRDLPDMPD